MSKYEIDDDHSWTDDTEDDTETEPKGELTEHHITVVDRDADPEMRYRYVFEDGQAIGILRDHKLAGSAQWDPHGAAKPFEVPGWCRSLLEDELGVDSWVDVVDTERCQEFADVPGP